MNRNAAVVLLASLLLLALAAGPLCAQEPVPTYNPDNWQFSVGGFETGDDARRNG